MTMLPTTSKKTTRLLGQLCVGADWACAHGDFETLGHIARQLASLVAEPIHCELAALASACTADPDSAAVSWDRLRNRVYRSTMA